MEEISSWCLHPQWLLLHPYHFVRMTRHLLLGSLQLGFTGTKKSRTNQMSETRSWLCIVQKKTINHGFLMMGFIIVLLNFSNTKKQNSNQNEHLISIPWYFVVESICSGSRDYMSICINCHHSNCVMIQITYLFVLSGRLFKYICTWIVRATTLLRIWTDILQNTFFLTLFLNYVYICSKNILKEMKYWYVA